MAEEEETREVRQKRIEANSRRLGIRTAVQNLHKMPGMSDDMSGKMQGAMKDFLPVLKDELKIQIAAQSERMGVGAEKKSYLVRNGAEGLEFHIMKNLKFAQGTEVVMTIKAKTILERIDKYQNPASLIADALTGRIFQVEDYIIDEVPAAEEQHAIQNTDEQKQLPAANADGQTS